MGTCCSLEALKRGGPNRPRGFLNQGDPLKELVSCWAPRYSCHLLHGCMVGCSHLVFQPCIRLDLVTSCSNAACGCDLNHATCMSWYYLVLRVFLACLAPFSLHCVDCTSVHLRKLRLHNWAFECEVCHLAGDCVRWAFGPFKTKGAS